MRYYVNANLPISNLAVFYVELKFGRNSDEAVESEINAENQEKYVPKKTIVVGHSGMTCWFEAANGDIYFTWMVTESPSERRYNKICKELYEHCKTGKNTGVEKKKDVCNEIEEGNLGI